MYTRFILLFFGILFSSLARSADQYFDENPPTDSTVFRQFEDSLKVLGIRMMEANEYVNRDKARIEFTGLLSEFLKLEKSFDYPLDSIKTISIQSPDDRSFRMFSWQVCENSNSFHYYGIIQKNNPKEDLIFLKDKSSEIRSPESDILGPDEWYGVLYYSIHQVGPKNKRYYLLFGFDANDLYNRKKVIEVLRFTDNGPVFGAPVFQIEEKDKLPAKPNRFVIQYSAQSGSHLNYDDALKMIVYDNLIPIGSLYDTDDMIMVPDGSYRGLILKNGIWTSIEKVFHQTQDEAPRPNPILDGRKGSEGLFGPGKGDQ